MSQQPPPQQAPYGPPQWGQQASSPNGQMPYGQPPPQSLQRQYPSVQAQWGEQRSPSSLSRSVSVGNQLPQQQPPPWMVPQQPPFPPPSPSYTNPQGHQDDSRSENKKHGRGRTIALVCALLVAVVLLGYGLTVAVQRFSGSKPSVSPTVQRAVASPTTAAPLSLTATPPHKLKPSKVVVILSKADFSPALLTIAVGSTVIWKNTSPVAHTVTSDNGTFDSGDLPTGGTFRFTFKTAGTFHYCCAYHSWMRGTITVQQT